MAKIVKKERYKAAVIGIGRIGMFLESDPKRLKPATHVGMWMNHPRVDLAAVCDNDAGKFEKARAMKPDVATYTDPEKLLREVAPDIVSISTWKDTHYEMMKLALRYGVPAIVCEKPIAEKYEHAQEVVDEAKKRGVHLFINHRRRFDPLLYPLREDLAGGIIGDIIQVSCYYVYGLVTTGTHLIDTLRFLLKDVAGDVRFVAGYPNTATHHHPDGDPCVDGFIGFENGLKASIQSLNIRDYDIFNFYLYGRKGLVVFKNVGRDIEIYKVENSPEHQGFAELAHTPVEVRGGKPRDQFGFLANNVIECLEGKATSLSTGDDSMKALEILLAFQKSVASGSRIITLGA